MRIRLQLITRMDLEYFIYLAFLATIGGIMLYVRRWKKYDPQWLITLALEQYPDDFQLHEAIANCTRIKDDHFVNADKPNKSGSEWQYERSVTLVHPEMDEIILDVLKDGRIGSIEYLGLLMRK